MNDTITVILKCDVCLREFQREVRPETAHGIEGLFARPQIKLEISRDSYGIAVLSPIRFKTCCDDCWVTIRRAVEDSILAIRESMRTPGRVHANLEGVS